MANVTMAPKFEKKGFCKGQNHGVNHAISIMVALHANWKAGMLAIAHRPTHTYTEKKALSAYR